MTFNIADEMFGEIMLPKALVGARVSDLSILLFELSLVVKYVRERKRVSCEIWVMNGENRDLGIQDIGPSLYVLNYKKSLILHNENNVISGRVLERSEDYCVSTLSKKHRI
ncbi:hypothetical protein H5410_023741, partial [Solanum commersonii]